MAEPLKNMFGPDVPVRLANAISGVAGDFDADRFRILALDGFDDLELTQRARHISEALAETLPLDRKEAMEILVAGFGPEIEGQELTGMDGFYYLPVVFFIADYGLDDFETAMTAQYEVTKRFTAEFSIRAFIDRYPQKTMSILSEWALDPNVHVRRLVSEGTRPRLPWAPRLSRFVDDPSDVVGLLELLKDDPEEYVRRSVANNLNDISKDHPDLVVETAQRWWSDGSDQRRQLIRHGLRTLIKAGHLGALEVLGFGPGSPVEVSNVRVDPGVVPVGSKVRVEVELVNPGRDPGGALVDLRVHFVKASGSTSPKVFKGGERNLEPSEVAVIRKSISLAQHSTRKHYPGIHEIEVQINGSVVPGGSFEVVGP